VQLIGSYGTIGTASELLDFTELLDLAELLLDVVAELLLDLAELLLDTVVELLDLAELLLDTAVELLLDLAELLLDAVAELLAPAELELFITTVPLLDTITIAELLLDSLSCDRLELLESKGSCSPGNNSCPDPRSGLELQAKNKKMDAIIAKKSNIFGKYVRIFIPPE